MLLTACRVPCALMRAGSLARRQEERLLSLLPAILVLVVCCELARPADFQSQAHPQSASSFLLDHNTVNYPVAD